MKWPEIKAYIDGKIATFGLYVITSTSSAKGQKDSVTVLGAGGKKVTLPCRRLGMFGHRAIPPKDCEGIVLRLGGKMTLVLLAAESLSYGRTDLKDGETQLYCKVKGCEVHLDEQGKNNINAAPGKDVVVNGGTKPVARQDDPVGYLMYVVSTSMAGPVVTAVSWSPTRPVPPFVTPPVPGVPGSYYLPMSITGGADRFKA